MNLMDQNLEELEGLLLSWGEPRFRARQVFEWLQKGARPEDMTNLPKALRNKLSALPFGGAKIHTRRISEIDGTVKYLFELEDQNLVEGVLMHYDYGNTLCLSTQVGCNMGCAFCASTLAGCVRNLTAGEMLSQVALVEADEPCPEHHVRSVTNIVLMGSGEPLLNYESVVRFLKLVSMPGGMNISPRNISLSTCGLVPRIYTLIKEAPHVTLSISLHAPNNKIRSKLMPINQTYPIEMLVQAAKDYAQGTGRRVIFEYALIKGVNSERVHAMELADLVRGVNCHVNLIPLNPVPEHDLFGVSRADAYAFAGWLDERSISASVRREMGADIEGACGQLRRRVLEEGS
ncbi:MAG: 23S rRNA (adenine(2503)-C(2))-methyltransferase RlmN [Bacillota bacterium]